MSKNDISVKKQKEFAEKSEKTVNICKKCIQARKAVEYARTRKGVRLKIKEVLKG